MDDTMLKEFNEFAVKGNMLDMAVGIRRPRKPARSR